jgi:hypothetical protein
MFVFDIPVSSNLYRFDNKYYQYVDILGYTIQGIESEHKYSCPKPRCAKTSEFD